ncbi:SPOR domain-containing protein [Acinetobacter sp. ANC 4648]|uniref:SPOR domain-containing protein n=1 Tax=Acinetobacter sp. ANC 4648 TaxID=1977875 RepID=UPI000A339EB2|nr:SPOR domain-containing protein [Acinetobacter sp. ANC 4648]OTG80018.1 cell division protein [Acinetobacter sp. ANC 4648]
MSMNNKQRWMGGVVLLGGGVLLAALLLKGKEEIHQKQTQITPTEQVQQQNKASFIGEAVQLQPLTVDVATEKRLLEEQKRSREKAVAEQEAKAADFLRMQQQAEADAARKAAEEYAAMNARRGATAQEGTDIPPELVQDEKTKAKLNAADQKKLEQQQTQQKQKAEIEKKLIEQKQKLEVEKKLAEQKRKDAEIEKKAEADKKAAEEKKLKAQEEAKKKAEVAQAEVERKKAEADKKAAEDKKHKVQEEAKKKAEAEKARTLLENGDKQWMVQVALAANEANADALASKLRAKGYKVTRSQTSKGIRIMVGPSKDRDSADAARKKITTDVSLGLKSAWVMDWVPLDQR